MPGRISRIQLSEQSLALAPVFLLMLWSLTFVLRGHLPFLLKPAELNADEGYVMAIGQRMLHGHMLPYVDGVAHGGPLFTASGAVIALFGEFSWLPIRVASLLCFLGNIVLMFVAARGAGFSLAGALAGVAVPAFCLLRVSPVHGVAYNAEVVTNMALLASLALATYGLRFERPRPMLACLSLAGVFAATGAMCKQIGAPLTVPIALYVGAAILSNADLSPQVRVRMLAGFCIGAVAPVVLLLLWFWIAGGLHDLYYYVVTYNKDIYMVYADTISRWLTYKTWAQHRTVELALAASAIGWGLAQLARGVGSDGRLVAGYARHGFAITLAWMAALSVFGARASMREFDHYYILCLPWFGLLAGLIVEQASDFANQVRGAPTLAFLYALIVCLPAALVLEVGQADAVPMAYDYRTGRLSELDEVAEPRELCRLIQAHTKPTDRIFVWGFRPQLYVSCARLPASRYVFTTFVAGFVPWVNRSTVEEEDEHAVPGSRATLLRELEQSKPPIIVDAGYSMSGRYMTRYAALARYLNDHYTQLPIVGPDAIYTRK